MSAADSIETNSFQEAADVLETRRQQQPLWLAVYPMSGRVRFTLESLHRFVDALRQCTHIHSVSLCLFGDEDREKWRAFESRDVRVAHQLSRLFGDTLPNHPSLNLIFLLGWDTQWIKLLVESLPLDRRQPLETLSLDVVDPACAQEVARMIRRNVPVRELCVGVFPWTGGGAPSEGLKLICDSTTHNEHIQHLVLSGFSAVALPADALDQALGPGSRLVALSICVPLTREQFSSIIELLKTNLVLDYLSLGPDCFVALTGGSFAELEDLLLHHNHSLRTVRIASQGDPEQQRVDELLRRNAAARQALELDAHAAVAQDAHAALAQDAHAALAQDAHVDAEVDGAVFLAPQLGHVQGAGQGRAAAARAVVSVSPVLQASAGDDRPGRLGDGGGDEVGSGAGDGEGGGERARRG
jgi:hypothetical protein